LTGAQEVAFATARQNLSLPWPGCGGTVSGCQRLPRLGIAAERLGRKSRMLCPFGPSVSPAEVAAWCCAGARAALARPGRERIAPTRRIAALESREREMAVSGQDKTREVEQAARLLGRDDPESRHALGTLWDVAFDEGRLAALDELQDRFCVCMK